jgi:hypothetical protein
VILSNNFDFYFFAKSWLLCGTPPPPYFLVWSIFDFWLSISPEATGVTLTHFNTDITLQERLNLVITKGGILLSVPPALHPPYSHLLTLCNYFKKLKTNSFADHPTENVNRKKTPKTELFFFLHHFSTDFHEIKKKHIYFITPTTSNRQQSNPEVTKFFS